MDKMRLTLITTDSKHSSCFMWPSITPVVVEEAFVFCFFLSYWRLLVYLSRSFSFVFLSICHVSSNPWPSPEILHVQKYLIVKTLDPTGSKDNSELWWKDVNQTVTVSKQNPNDYLGMCCYGNGIPKRKCCIYLQILIHLLL